MSLGIHNKTTTASGAVMACQMKDIASASHVVEASKIEVQLKLFIKQMSYQREKDHRLQNNAWIANKTTRLAIKREEDIVKCLTILCVVLSKGMHIS